MPPAFAPRDVDHDPALFADLIEQIARHGDRAAFARLFAFFAPRLKGWLLRQGLSPEAAENQAVEAMAAAWRRAASFDPRRDTPSGWIFRILRNQRLEAARPPREAALSAPPIAVRSRPRAVRPMPMRQAPLIQSRKAALISRG